LFQIAPKNQGIQVTGGWILVYNGDYYLTIRVAQRYKEPPIELSATAEFKEKSVNKLDA
jgi:hypothetical protein